MDARFGPILVQLFRAPTDRLSHHRQSYVLLRGLSSSFLKV